MKKPEELNRLLTEMYRETRMGKLHWKLQVKTTEYNSPAEKPMEIENGVAWIIDECYVAYECNYKGEDFCMITYEMIKTAGEKEMTTNLIFLPPMGIRVFHLPTLLPYAIQASPILANQIQKIWGLLLAQYKADKTSVDMDVIPGTLTIIED